MNMQSSIQPSNPANVNNQVNQYCVYIAFNKRVADLAADHCQRLALKIGYSSNIAVRLESLNGSYLGTVKPPCCGFSGWEIIGSSIFKTQKQAEAFDQLALEIFCDKVEDDPGIINDPKWIKANTPPPYNGTSDVRLMPNDFHSNDVTNTINGLISSNSVKKNQCQNDNIRKLLDEVMTNIEYDTKNKTYVLKQPQHNGLS